MVYQLSGDGGRILTLTPTSYNWEAKHCSRSKVGTICASAEKLIVFRIILLYKASFGSESSEVGHSRRHSKNIPTRSARKKSASTDFIYCNLQHNKIRLDQPQAKRKNQSDGHNRARKIGLRSTSTDCYHRGRLLVATSEPTRDLHWWQLGHRMYCPLAPCLTRVP